MPPLLTFAENNPFISFFLSWPLALILISVAWSVATVLNNLFSNILAILIQISSLITVLFRGYPPKNSNTTLDDFLSGFKGEKIEEEEEKENNDRVG